MELWDLYTSLVFRLNYFVGARQIIGILLTCYIICPLTIKAEVCGSSQKKFVWTTAWPMEENYVTYKLIGPLIDRQNIPSSGSNSLNQHGLNSHALNTHGHPPNYFLYLSTPKEYEDGRSLPSAITESNRGFERIGLKTEAELDELSGKLDAYCGDDQPRQHTVSLVHPSNVGRSAHTALSNNTDSSPRKQVFSEQRLNNSSSTIKLQKAKKHMSDLLNESEKETYFNPLSTNARSHQFPLAEKILKTVLNASDIGETHKGSYYSSDVLPKPRRVAEPSVQNDKPLQGGPSQQKTVSKKTHASSFNHRKSKPSDPIQFSKSARMGSGIANNDPFMPKHSFTKYNKVKSDPFNDTPSNILRVIKISPEPSFKLSINDSANFHLVDSTFPGTFPKISGKFPPYRFVNNSLSRLPASSHNILKGSSRVVTPMSDMLKGTDNIKELKTEAKSSRLDKLSEESNVVKSTVKSGNTAHKTQATKGEKQINIVEKSSAKKRRENPYPKTNVNENSIIIEREPRVQTKIRKLPLRYRSRLSLHSNGVSANNSNYILSFLKDSSPSEDDANNQ